MGKCCGNKNNEPVISGDPCDPPQPKCASENTESKGQPTAP